MVRPVEASAHNSLYDQMIGGRGRSYAYTEVDLPVRETFRSTAGRTAAVDCETIQSRVAIHSPRSIRGRRKQHQLIAAVIVCGYCPFDRIQLTAKLAHPLQQFHLFPFVRGHDCSPLEDCHWPGKYIPRGGIAPPVSCALDCEQRTIR